MGQIFHKAKRVLIWLGEASEQDQVIAHALKYLKKGLSVSHLLHADLRSAKKLFPPRHGGSYIAFEDREVKRRKKKVKPGDPRLSLDNIEWQLFLFDTLPRKDKAGRLHPVRRHLVNILDNPYWRRLWIVQEVILAKDPRVILGSHSVALGDIHAMSAYRDMCSYFGYKSDFYPRTFDSPMATLRDDWVLRYKTQEMFHLANLLTDKYGSRECQNVHDQVYGILSLTNWNPKFFTIDYSQPVEILFTVVTKYMSEEGWTTRRYLESKDAEFQVQDQHQAGVVPIHAAFKLLKKLDITAQSATSFTRTSSEAYSRLFNDPCLPILLHFKGFLILCRDHGPQSPRHRCIELRNIDGHSEPLDRKLLEWTQDNPFGAYQLADIVVSVKDDGWSKTQGLEVLLVLGLQDKSQTFHGRAPNVHQIGRVYSHESMRYGQTFAHTRNLSAEEFPNLISHLIESTWMDMLSNHRASKDQVLCSSQELIYLLDCPSLEPERDFYGPRVVEMEEDTSFRTGDALLGSPPPLRLVSLKEDPDAERNWSAGAWDDWF